MKGLLYYLLQVIICSGILYGYYHFALRNKKFHLYNRFYLLLASLISVVLPFLNIPVYFAAAQEQPSIILQALTAISSNNNVSIQTALYSVSTTSVFTFENISKLFYLLIACLLFIRFLHATVYIKRLLGKYVVERIDRIYFINTEEPGTPFSFFKWLFWNKKIDLKSKNGEQIFRHELFHIQQKHSSDVVLMEIVTAIFWVNPFFHFIKKELKVIHEFLADEFATKEKDKWNYAELLLMRVLDTHSNHLIIPFFNNQIKRRIAMITSSQKTSYQYLRKIMVLPIAIIVITLFAFNYKNKRNIKKDTVENPNTDTVPKPDIKKSFFYSHPDKLILEADTLIFYPEPNKNQIDLKNALVIINGQKKETAILKKKTIISDRITFYSKGDRMTVEKFGKEGENGVIIFENAVIINTPPSEFYKDDFAKTKPVEADSKIFEKVEVDPSFTGGESAWRNFLEKNLKASIPADKGAPVGSYTVWLKFIVDEEGNINDIQALTNHEYGMEEECLRVMRLSTKWIPATQNGHIVKAYRKQPITFLVAEKIHLTTHDEYPIPPNEDYNDPDFRKKWHKMISEIKAIAWKEGKAAYEYRGRTYILAK